MAGSAVAGEAAFRFLGDGPVIGVITALTVDFALGMWLRIARRCRALGIVSPWGRVLELTTAAMTLYLNVGAALFQGLNPVTARPLLAVAHAFLPIVLILVTLAGSQSQLRLWRLRQARLVAEQDEERAQQALQQTVRQDAERRRGEGELVAARDYLDHASELRKQAEAELVVAERARQTVRQAVRQNRPKAATNKPPSVRQERRDKTTPAPAEERREWVRQERAAGRNPSGADVDRHFGPPRTGARIVADVDAKKRPLQAIPGGRP